MDLPLQIPEFSIGMVEELLGGLSDWKGVQDIIRLTIKALSEVVKSQSSSISNLNRTISSLPDIQVYKDLESKISSQISLSLDQILSEKVSRKELQAALISKASQDQLKEKISVEEFYSECRSTHSKFEKLQSDFSKKLLDLSLDTEIQKIAIEIKQKPSWEELQHILETKLNKDSFESLLSKKVSLKDLEDLLGQKAGLFELETMDLKLKKTEKNLLDQITSFEQKQIVISKKIEGILEKFNEFDPIEIEEKIIASQQHFKAEMDAFRKNANSQITKKADYSEISNIYETLKVGHKESMELIEKLNKEQKQSVIDLRKEVKKDSKKYSISVEFCEKISEEIEGVKSQMLKLLEDRKKDISDNGQALKNIGIQIKKEFSEEISKISEKVQEKKKLPADNVVKKQEINTIKNELKALSDQKASKEDFSVFLATRFQEMVKSVKDLKKKSKESLSKPDLKLEKPTPQAVTQKEPNFLDALSKKAEKSDIENLTISLQQILSEFNYLKSELNAKLQEIDLATSKSNKVIEDFSKDIKSKAASKEILTLLENKANIEDTNKALIEIHKELDCKLDSEYYARSMVNYEQSISSLWSSNSLGRWSWKSGELRQTLIPWEFQLCNSVPEIFIWEKDKSSLVVMNSGVYFVNLAVFSKKKNRIQICINGESGLDTGAKQNIPSNRVISEFIIIPARARVSVSFSGDLPAQALLELIKFT